MKNKILVCGHPPQTYLDAVGLVGLDCDCKFGAQSAEGYAGLLLTGGGDVFPSYYGGKTPCRRLNVFRDEAEFETLASFVKADLPVLGVCRGMQVINVFFGGAIKNLYGHFAEDKDLFHEVSCKDFCEGLTVVNSSHRQAVDKLADGFIPAAFSSDGSVEAMRKDRVFAVQFHPERMDEKAIRIIYGAFSDAIVELNKS